MSETVTSDLNKSPVRRSAFILLQLSGGPDVFIEDHSLDETRQNEQWSVVSDILCLSLPILVNNLGRDATETCETLRLKKEIIST